MLVPEEIAMQAQEDRRQQMLELARQWRDGGMSARAFAEGHGVTPWTLYYWRERLTKRLRMNFNRLALYPGDRHGFGLRLLRYESLQATRGFIRLI